MATIASLGVSLTARIGNFEKGFKKAQRIASRFASDLTRHVKTIASYGLAIAGVAAGALSVLVKGQLEAVDSASKLSRTLGLTTEELVGYQHAASLAGVDAEKLAAGILKINKSADSAMAGLSTNDRILAIANQYQAIGNAADRAAYLTKIFGRSGLEMGALLEQGAAGILAARKEAEQLGLTFTSQQGLMVEAANDAATRINAAITGIARQLAIQLAPYIEAVSNRLVAFAQNGNTTGTVVVNAINFMGEAVAKLTSLTDLMKASWLFFKGVVLGAFAIMLKGSKLVAFAIEKISVLLGVDRMEGFSDAFAEFADSFAEASVDAFKEAGKALENFASGTNAQKVRTLFEAVSADAAEIAKVGALAIPNVADTFGSSMSGKTAEFREVDLSRVAIGGHSSSKDRPAGRDQMETLIEATRQVAQNTRSRPVLV